MAWIHELYVDPEARRSGIAGELVAGAVAFFAERGAPRISVRVETGNQPGLDFWGSQGFLARATIFERKP